MEYKQFKITNKVKRELAREIKELIKDQDYVEVGIMYNVNEDKFFTTETGKMDKLEYEGNVKYNIFTYYRADGNLTLEKIEEKIFN